MNSQEDLYEILQVHHSAEPEVIEAAYRRLLRMYHPDVNDTQEAHSVTVRLNRAYEVLGDPARRAEYDQGSRRSDSSGDRGRQQRGWTSQDGSRQTGYSHSERGDEIGARDEPRTSVEWREYVNYAFEETERGNYEPLNWTSAAPAAKGLTRQLFDTVFEGDSWAVRPLVSEGADLNARNFMGQTPLLLAVLHDDTHTAEVLISMGADLNAIDGQLCRTPLGLAYRNIELVALLIAAGADPNITDDVSRATPLHNVAQTGDTEIALALLSGGAEIDIVDSRGQTPTYWAELYGHVDIVAAFEQVKRAVRQQESEGPFQAVENGDIELVRALLSAGADPNARDALDSTLLHIAVVGDLPSHIKIVSELIDSGADIYARNGTGFTALYLAVITGRAQSIPVLIAGGADIEARYDGGFTPLHAAVVRDKVELISVLMASGADVNAKADFGATPLHRAAFADKVESIRVLIACGANIEARNEGGGTPMHMAASRRKVESLSLLIESGADIEATNDYNETPLHTAALIGNTDVAVMLLDAGANANTRDSDGQTPYYVARENENMIAADAIASKGGM